MQRAIKWAIGLLCTIAFFCGGFVILHGSLPPASINAWLPAGNLTASRSGAASVLLQDGRLLITGGCGASGALAATEVLDPANGFTAGPSMNLARSNHVAVLLQDGRVLVAGGTDASGRASQSAEIFDAASNSWSAAGPLMVGRSGATATLLPSGQVLIAGGAANGAALASLELFDPSSNTFSLVAGALSSPRENHAAAMLPDGRVLITGGWDGTTLAPVPPATAGTANVLASTDIFDPSTGAVAPGPALTSPRMNFTATTALDGSVIAIGGTDGQNDLASIEVLAPGAGAFALSGAKLATARQGHLAFLLPHNGNILIVGGTSSAAAVSSTELYTPWTGATSVTGAMASARSGATGNPLFQTVLGAPVGIDGALLVAGGLDASSPPSTLQSAEVFGFATITTDKSDYPPGVPVTITGSGWQPGEVVQMSLVEVPDLDGDSPIPLTATANANGNVTNTSFSTNVDDINVHFTLTAVGAVSQAQTMFTDNKNVTVAFAGTGSGSVANSVNSNTCTDSSGSASGAGCIISAGNTATVTLTATATSPSTIGAWTVPAGYAIASGTCTTGNATCTFTLDNNARTVTLAFNPGAATHYLVTSSNNSPAAGSQVTISAQLADSGGNPVSTSGKTVTWTHSGSGGSFSTGTSVTNASGVATVNFTTGTVAGTGYTITATDNTSITGTSGNITTVAGTLTTLVFGQQPTNTLAGQTITPAVTVTEKDSNGNTITSDNSTHLTISILNNPSTGTLSGATNVVVSAGVATFSSLSINNPGNGYTLQAHAPGNINVTSNPFNITGQFNVTFGVLGMLTAGSADSTGTVVSISGTSGGVAVGPFNETAANLPSTHSFDSGTTVTYTYTSTVTSSVTGKQYVLTTPAPSPASGFTVSSALTVTGTYKTQYQLTLGMTAGVPGGTGTNISGGTTGTFYDSGTVLSLTPATPVADVAGKQWVFKNWTGDVTSPPNTSNPVGITMSAPRNVTASYTAQYQVTFNLSGVSTDVAGSTQVISLTSPSAQSVTFSQVTSNSYSEWFDAGSTVSGTFADPLASTTAGERYALTSGSPFSFSNLSAPQMATGTYKVQWQVTFNLSGVSTDVAGSTQVISLTSPAGSVTFSQFTSNNYTQYFDAGSTVGGAFADPLASTTSGKQYALTSGSPFSFSSLSAPQTATATYKVQWQVTFNLSGVSTDVAGTAQVVSLTSPAGSVTFSQFTSNSYTQYFDAGSAVSGAFADPLASTTSGRRYALVSGSPFSFTSLSGPQTATGTYKVQYQVTFNLSGVSTDVAGSTQVISLTSPSAQSVTFSQFTSNSYSQWFDAGSTVSGTFADPLASTTAGERYAQTSGSPFSFSNLSAAQTATGTYKVQYQVTFNLGGVSTDVAGSTQVVSLTSPSAQSVTFSQFTSNSYSQWFDGGSTVSGTFADPLASTTAGKQYKLISGSPISFSSLSTAQTATGTYGTQWQVTLTAQDQSNTALTDTSGTVVTVNAVNKTTNPYQAYFDANSTPSFSFPAVIASTTTGKQYAYVSQSTTSPLAALTGPVSVTATYKTQYEVTFTAQDQSNTALTGTSGTVVTVNAVNQTTNPYQAYFDANSTPSFSFPAVIASTTTGKQFAYVSQSTTSPLAALTGPVSVTASYKTQYQVTFTAQDQSNTALTGTSGTVVTVNSVDQTTNPYQVYFDANSTPSFSFPTTIASTTTGKRYAFVSQSTTSPLAALTGPVSVTATYKTQYQLTFTASGVLIGGSTDTSGTMVAIAGTGSTSYSATEAGSGLPIQDWFDNGATLSVTYTTPMDSASTTGKRYRLDSITGGTVTLPATAVTVSAPLTVTGSYVVQYEMTFKQSGIPTTDIAGTTNVVTVKGTPEPFSALPYSAYFDANTAVPYTYYSPVASSNAGEQFALTSTSPASITSLTAPTTVTGTYVVQYQVTFAASGLGNDATGTATVVNFSGTAAGSPASGSVTVAQLGTSAASVFFDSSQTLTYTYGSPVSTGDTHKRYILTTPAPTPATGFTVTATITITAAYKAQYDTTTVVVSSVNPSILAQPVQFTATVTTIAPGGGTPTGSVQFKVDGSNFGSPVALSGGTANSTTTTTLTVGTHTVEVDYTSDTDTYTSSMGTLSGGQKVQYMTGGTCDGDLGHSILQPINVDGSSVFKQTSTVPAKFRVCDFNGNSIGTTGVVSTFRLVQVVSGTIVNTVDEAVDSTTPDTMFRWDPTGQQWIFNISTKGAPVNVKNQTYYFTISLNDGSTILFHFGLR